MTEGKQDINKEEEKREINKEYIKARNKEK